MVSLKDISIKCGVSVATVSKALNGQKDIGKDTKELVLRTAAEMHYQPNPIAKALRTKCSHTIGIILTGEDFRGLSDEFFSHLFLEIKNSCEEMGYEILFLNKRVGNQSMTYLERCKYRNIDGVILAYAHYRDPQVQELLDSDIPVITADYVENNRSAVCFDYVAGMQSLVNYIYEMGHRKIAYIHGEDKDTNTHNRVSSFYRTAEKLGIQVADEYVREGRYIDVELCRKLTAELLKLPDPPTCIIYPNDYSAIAGIGEITRQGLAVPRDISVAGYDSISVAEVVWPELTTYAQNAKDMGKTLVRELVGLIEEPQKATIEQKLITGTLIPGASVRRIP